MACDAAIHAGGKAMELGPALLAVGEGEWPDHFEPFAAAPDPAWIQPALSAADTQRWRGPGRGWRLPRHSYPRAVKIKMSNYPRKR